MYNRRMTVSVEVSNLGPLRSARADIADLNVFVGRNNTGKTFFATVLHRVLNASSPVRPVRWPLQDVPPSLQEWIETQISLCLDQNDGEPRPLANPSQDILEWVKSAADDTLRMFGLFVLNDIEYAFGVEASELRRRTKSRRAHNCFLRINDAKHDWEVKIPFDSDDIENDIESKGPDPHCWLARLPEKIQQETKMSPQQFAPLRGQDFERNTSYHMGRIYRSWLSDLYEGLPPRAVHLPAGRSGIMGSYQVLAGAIVRQASEAGIRPIEIEPLPGTSSDLLSFLIKPPGRSRYRKRSMNSIRSLINKLEKKMGATIERVKSSGLGKLVVVLTPEGEFPISRASSMFSELAPLVLAFKGDIGRGEYLTIDEPEAHLHPAMQRTIASFLVEAVDLGIGVILTTHSDIFLGELNNAIRARKLNEQTISALLFTRDDKWGVNKKLDIDNIDGIDDSTFREVKELLYDETADLIDDLLINTRGEASQ